MTDAELFKRASIPEPKLSRDVALVSSVEQLINCRLPLDCVEPLQLWRGRNKHTSDVRQRRMEPTRNCISRISQHSEIVIYSKDLWFFKYINFCGLVCFVIANPKNSPNKLDSLISQFFWTFCCTTLVTMLKWTKKMKQNTEKVH